MTIRIDGTATTIVRQCRGTAAVLSALLLGACTAQPFMDKPIDSLPPDATQSFTQAVQGGRDNETLVLLAFSGGGTRAAAFAYGVMQGLAATTIVTPEGERRLLDEVDIISSVSGGSFPNAYYTLFGDRIFEDFEERFLRVKVQSMLKKRLFTKAGELGSRYFGRSDMAAQLYDELLFDNKTFSATNRPGAPVPIINSTDIASGVRIAFTPIMFDMLCADLDSYPISRAVAASSAVPGLATPITLRNYAGQCGFDTENWIQANSNSTLSKQAADGYRAYLNPSERPWLHLVDGGIADNLGLRSFYTIFSLESDPKTTLKRLGHADVKQIIIISVNAATHHYPAWGKDPKPPRAGKVLGNVSGILMSRYTNDTTHIVRNAYADWAEKSAERGEPVNFEFVEVSFDQVRNPLDRQRLNDTPTSFEITGEQVDALIKYGREVLLQSKDYRQFIQRNEGSVKSP